MNTERLEETRDSRSKAIDAKFHAQGIMLALEVYYWTGDMFHYHSAIDEFESLVSEMAKLQHLTREGK